MSEHITVKLNKKHHYGVSLLAIKAGKKKFEVYDKILGDFFALSEEEQLALFE